MQLVRSFLGFSLLVLPVTGCSGGGEGGGTPARMPARSGDVLEVAAPEDRATAPGAVAAFVNGLHTVVVDGKDAFAGQTRLTGTTSDSGLTLPLAGGLTANLVPAGDDFRLTFSTGEAVAMRRRSP